MVFNSWIHCFCLMHGFNWLALLQQPLWLSNSGHLKQVVTSWFSMKSAFLAVLVLWPTMHSWNSYMKALIYFVLLMYHILSEWNWNRLLDFHLCNFSNSFIFEKLSQSPKLAQAPSPMTAVAVASTALVADISVSLAIYLNYIRKTNQKNPKCLNNRYQYNKPIFIH